MQVHELLENRKAEILSEISKLQTELAEIDRMLGVSGAVTQRRVTQPQATRTDASAGVSETQPRLPVPATKDDAILQAIENGNRTPATIGDFIRKELGMEVNDASTRTRLSRMKAADKIDHDGNGWKLK